MDTAKRSPLDRLLFSTFLKGRTSSREILNEKGEISPEENQKIEKETNEILNDDSTYPFISYLSDYWQSPSRPMMMSRSCMTASTKLRQHWDRTAPMCSAHCLQS